MRDAGFRTLGCCGRSSGLSTRHERRLKPVINPDRSFTCCSSSTIWQLGSYRGSEEIYTFVRTTYSITLTGRGMLANGGAVAHSSSNAYPSSMKWNGAVDYTGETMATSGDRCWPQAAKQDGEKICTRFLCYVWKKRDEHRKKT